MTKKRMTRKELLKEPDEFMTQTGRIISWVKLNPKPLTYGGCVILAIIILATGYGYYQNNRAGVSADLLGESLSQYYQLANDGDPAKAVSAVGPDFDRLIDRFGGQPAGRLGCLLYAHFNLKGQAPQKAVDLYQTALERYENDPSLTPVILHGLASASQAAGDAPLAISHYERLLSLDSMTYKDSALFHLGRLYMEAGNVEKSQAMFDQLSADYPDSSYSRLAREKSVI